MTSPVSALRAGPLACAVIDCPEPAVGLMEWPDIHTALRLCQSHADYVGAIERGTDSHWDRAIAIAEQEAEA